MSKVTLFLSFIVFCIVFEIVISAKPVASADCSTIVYNMIDCLSFVSNDSKVSKPEGTCCNGLKTVLRTDASCVCEGFKSSSQFGIKLNITRAVSLPSKCGLNVPPSVNHCGMSLPPSAAPAQPPSLVAPGVQVVAPAVAPTESSSDTDNVNVAPAVAPTESSSDTDNVNVAPAPSSSNELSSANSISLLALLLASLVAAAA